MEISPKPQNSHLQSQKKAEYTEKRSDSDQHETETTDNTEEKKRPHQLRETTEEGLHRSN